MFVESGFEAMMNEVAASAGIGVGVGTAYCRFANKDETVGALFNDRIAALVAVFDHALSHRTTHGRGSWLSSKAPSAPTRATAASEGRRSAHPVAIAKPRCSDGQATVEVGRVVLGVAHAEEDLAPLAGLRKGDGGGKQDRALESGLDVNASGSEDPSAARQRALVHIPCAIADGNPNSRAVRGWTWMGFRSPDTPP